MENLRLKRENTTLEKKIKELQTQIHELMSKNNSLNQEILYLKYSNKETNYKQPTNNNLIIELNKTISDLKSKINQITKEKTELTKINTQLKVSNNFYFNEKQRKLKQSGSANNNIIESKKLNEILNKNIINLQNEISKNKKIIQELTEENNDINRRVFEYQKNNEQLSQKIKDNNKILEQYKEKCSKISKELSDEKDINAFNEQKIKSLERKLEEYNINEFYDQKTKTYKVNKINKVNEIEMEKLTKFICHSPCCRKNTSTFNTTNTTNKIIFINNNLDDVEISPDKYTIVKQFKLNNNLKWYLLKKLKKHNYDQKGENSPSSRHGSKQQSRRSKYIKQNSKQNNNINIDDSYSDFIWKSNKNEKDFINFNIDIIDNDENDNSFIKQKKINELESCIKDLEEKLAKKENDCNRINLNYAKLFNRSKLPEMSYENLLEKVNKLKEEKKILNKKIENLKISQNFIGFSFIEDDLQGSRFIDDNCFEKILDELNNNKNKNINMLKYFRSHEDEKDNSKKDFKRLKESNSDKKFLLHKKIISNNDQKNNNIKNDNTFKHKINNANISPIKTIIKKDNINYNLTSFKNDIKSPSKINTIKENKNIILMNHKANENLMKNNYEKKEVINKKTDDKKINTFNEKENNIDKNYTANKFKTKFRNNIETHSNIFTRNNSKNNTLISEKSKIKENLNNKYLRNARTVKMDHSNKIDTEKKNECFKDSTIKISQYASGRRFYRKRQESVKTSDANEK